MKRSIGYWHGTCGLFGSRRYRRQLFQTGKLRIIRKHETYRGPGELIRCVDIEVETGPGAVVCYYDTEVCIRREY